jgi:hypothetical protein
MTRFQGACGRRAGVPARFGLEPLSIRPRVVPRDNAEPLLTWEHRLVSGTLPLVRNHREQSEADLMRQTVQRPNPGTFRARLEITNRSGHLTREYRLLLRPGGVRVAYAVGRVWYDVGFDAERGEVVCTCPAFEADGHCKHRDAVLALLDGLAHRLGRPA